ncbi:MAG: TIGR02206 family membrane protein [Gemmatimonadetes bacterium]|nr:TIGR02206 family membrane protein [Gemmatimonadota bacterium]MYD26425.1 TIGR02206 family membrane protein [Gemmatimonadota bacterium]MYI98952.1 TIGR02206 family membrane protein [Gemmatimonadota bacterium]
MRVVLRFSFLYSCYIMTPTGFQTFGTSHLIVMGLTLVLPILLSGLAKRAGDERTAGNIGYLLAAVLLVNEFSAWGYRLVQFGPEYIVRHHLPLHICGVANLVTAATLIFRNKYTYEIAYFWGLVGSLNAVITPGAMDAGFPSWRFFQYFIAHSGIVVAVLYATWGLGMRPTLRGLFRAFVALNVFAVVVGIVNLLLGSNYMYLSRPPWGTVSPFFFAPWPWYIPILDVVALAMFFAVYLPVHLSRRREARQIRPADRSAPGKPA